MSFNLDSELDLNFNSSSLADDLEGFVKSDAVQEEQMVDGFSTEEQEEPAADGFSTEEQEEPATDDLREEDENDEIDSLLDDQLNQIFSTEDFNADFDDNFEQSAEEENVDKYYQEDNVNLESVVDESTYAEIKYPCLLLNGASTNEEVDFLRSFSTEENNSKAIYLYCEAAQGVCEIGYIKLTLKFLLTLSRMPGYRLYSLYSDTSERNEIKLDDPNVLSNFISL